MHILHVVGARPNLMKVAPVLSALRQYPGIKQSLIHTGQHYDTNMSDVFFQQLEIPAPDYRQGPPSPPVRLPPAGTDFFAQVHVALELGGWL